MNGGSVSSLERYPKGSTVRLVGLKNPDLKHKIATIVRYTRDGERVMVSVVDGPKRLHKVRPRQMEILEEPSGPDFHQSSPSMRPHGANSQQEEPLAGMNIRVTQEDHGMKRRTQGGGHGVSENSGLRRSMPMQSHDHGLRHSTQSDHGFRRSTRPQDREFAGSARQPDHGMNRSMMSQHLSGSMRSILSKQRPGDPHDISFRSMNGSTHSKVSDVMNTLRSADAMFDLADTSGDGMITEAEFHHYMETHTNHDEDLINECFRMIDIDNNGNITRDEVRTAYLAKRRGAKGAENCQKTKKFEDELLDVSKDADALFDEADVDRSGSLSKGEFELYMKRNTLHSDAAIWKFFDTMDTDKDGFITREEVRQMYMKKRMEGGEKMSLMDLLGLKDDEMREIEDDVYNMFFLSEVGDGSFWFAIVVFVLKMLLVSAVATDLFLNHTFPASAETDWLIKATQFFLLPVNVSVQEELIATFFIYANLKWNKHILELNPGATKGKFHAANFARFIDGLIFLLVNTVLLFQADGILNLLMNFTALDFLSSIDNVALFLARDGYLNESLERVAGDVLLMKLPYNHDNGLQKLDTVMFGIMFLVQLVAWIYFQFVRHLVT